MNKEENTMKKLIENAAELVKAKTLVTLAVTGVYVALALTGIITGDQVVNIFNIVIAFYFGTQHEKRSGGNG